MIYLDNAATTFPKHENVYSEMDRVNRMIAVNAGRGSYRLAREAEAIISETRSLIEELFSCKGTAEVVFTPSNTHAMNQILYGLEINKDSVIYISIYEHNAVARTVEQIRKNTGCKVEFIPVDSSTLAVDIAKTKFLFSQNHPSVVIMNVISNVTGYRLPVESIFALAKTYGAITIADAAQAAGLIDIKYNCFSANIICFAGHKTLCGPLGIGGFVIDKKLKLCHVLTGGTGSDSLNLNMPENSYMRYEASSPNIVAIAGLRAALKKLDVKEHETKIKELTKYLYEGLSLNPIINIVGSISDTENIGILSFTVEGYESEEVGKILDEEFNIAVRTGYHCAPYIHSYLKDKEYGGTVRVSLGYFNTKENIDSLIEAIETL